MRRCRCYEGQRGEVLEEVKVPHTLGGASYILNIYINSAKEVVSHVEVELYKPRRYTRGGFNQRLGLVVITNGPVCECE
jgi:hypothetical protein